MSFETFTVTLRRIVCPNCSGVYAISEDYRSEAELLGEFKKCWTCPYCKESRGYGTGESQRLKSQIERLEGTVERERGYRKQAEEAGVRLVHQVRAQKAAKTKIKNRIANGVCPCCTRTFQNLHRHMETKHPEFKGGET